MSSELFDTAVIDSNVFIALVETGIEKEILPIFKDKVPIDCVMPYELPRSDIPTRFRDLRQILPKYVKGVKVNRESSFWNWCGELAQRMHFIRVKDDPADIDVVVLARLLEKKKGKKVAVVSNDEGVIRTIREVTEFQGIQTMSSGTFLFTLSALVEDEDLSGVLTNAGDKLYNQYLAYRRKSRKFIDIKSLVSELKDTSVFIRNASKSVHGHDHSHDHKEATDVPQGEEPSIDEFETIINIVNSLNKYRESYNLMGGEEYLYSLTPIISKVLGEATNSDNYRMMISMFIGEIYSFRTWAMDVRLKTGGIFEASIHAENLLMIMNFMRVNKEIIEDVLALQSMLVLLNGKKQQALAISRQIPEEKEMSSAQLMALVCALVGQNTPEEIEKAKKLFSEFVIKKGVVDRDGSLNSILKFSNTAYLFNNKSLAINLLKLLLETSGNAKDDLIKEVAQRLYLLTRLTPNLLDKKSDYTVNFLLSKKELVDNTNKKIPTSYKKMKAIENEENSDKPFAGKVTILNQSNPFDKPEELHIIGFEENTRSTWRFIFPIDYAPSLAEALGFTLKGGEIDKILNRTQVDPEHLRGSILINNPSIQVEMQLHLE